MKRILFLCTANSCRSQMAEGWLRHLGGDGFEAFSAGTAPSTVHPLAIRVMAEAGVDIAGQRSKSVEEFTGGDFDLLVTVCGGAREVCPLFTGTVAGRDHWDVADPAAAEGTEEQRLEAFRAARDDLRARVEALVASPAPPAEEPSPPSDAGELIKPRLAALYWLLPLVAAALAYASLLGAGLVWDDAFVHTRQISYYTSLGDAFIVPVGTPFMPVQYYRPAVFFTFLLDHGLAKALGGPGADPAPFLHATNLLLHLAATGLVFALAMALLRGLRGRREGAMLAALFFGLNPVHLESVASVAGRTDIQATVFLLASLLCAARAAEAAKWKTWGVASGLLLLPALLSKENAAAHLALLPLFLWAMEAREGNLGISREALKRWLWCLAPALAATAVYFVLRINAHIHLLWDDTPFSPTPLANLLRAAGFGTFKSLIPWPLNPYVAELPPLALALGALAAAALALGAAWRRLPAARPWLVLASAWFCATLAPSLIPAVKPIASTLTAERYLYLPGVAVALLFGAGAAALSAKWKQPARLAALALVAAYGIGTAVAALHWQNERSFWQWASGVGGNENRVDVACALGEANRVEGRFDEADAALRRALDALGTQMNPKRVQVLRNLTMLQYSRAIKDMTEGRVPKALEEVEEGLALVGSIPPPLSEDAALYALTGVGLCLKDQGLTAMGVAADHTLLRQAVGKLVRAVMADPGNPEYTANLNLCRMRLQMVLPNSATPLHPTL